MVCGWRERKCGCGTTKPGASWVIRRDRLWKRCGAPRSGFGRTDIVKTWLLVAAERREFDGIRKRFGEIAKLAWPGAKFAGEAHWRGDRWWMVANGPGEALVFDALKDKKHVDAMISTGLCGALDPALRVGDIVVPPGVAFDTQ